MEVMQRRRRLISAEVRLKTREPLVELIMAVPDGWTGLRADVRSAKLPIESHRKIVESTVQKVDSACFSAMHRMDWTVLEAVNLVLENGDGADLLTVQARWFDKGKKEDLWWLLKTLKAQDIRFSQESSYLPGESWEGDESDMVPGRRRISDLMNRELSDSVLRNQLLIYVDAHGIYSLQDLRDFIVDQMFILVETNEAYRKDAASAKFWSVETEKNDGVIAELKKQLEAVDYLMGEQEPEPVSQRLE